MELIAVQLTWHDRWSAAPWVRDVELQQDLQRYAAQFTETVTQALDALERSPDRRVSDEALRRHLAYASAAIDIATGPFPEVNLLDMGRVRSRAGARRRRSTHRLLCGSG